MKQQIEAELQRLELEYDVTILYAVESGSRAWGFASTDSDWDVRFVYVHKTDWYLSIENKPDTIEMILPNDIDLCGWELRKTLNLFRKSNPALLEWLRSPIVYWERHTTAESLRTLSGEYFSAKSCMHHYLHMAERNVKEYLERDLVRVKKYFYMLRPILACRWIERTNTMAPMEFQTLVDAEVKEEHLKVEIQNLLVRKTSGEELDKELSIKLIDDFLNSQIEYFKVLLTDIESLNKPNIEKLDELFRKTLIEIDK